MRLARSPRVPSAWRTMAALLAAVLAVALLLAACGGPEPTAQVLVVTATFTPQPAVIVVTATFTPASQSQAVLAQDTAPPPEPIEPPSPTAQPVATDTPPPAPTDTPLPPPPTDTPIPPPADTPTPKPAAKPQASLNAYGVIYSNFDGGDEADENKYSVWVMRGDGNEAKEILRPALEPAYSPNGKKIAYYRPFNGIWIYDLDKQSAAHVVASDYAEFASFSPEGNRLVFHEWVGNWWSADVNLYIVNTDGSGRTQLPQGMRPTWALKGDLMVFDSCRGTSCGIFVVNSNGQGLRQVTSDGGGKASWSPDGKRIVYSADVAGNPEIMVVNVDGSGKKQLTKNKGNDSLPVYSPDGQYIYFLSDQNGTAWAIRAMKADGSDVKTIHKVGVPPRWQFSRLWVGWW